MRFPKRIKENMLAFENGDFLRIPTEKEIFGKNCESPEEPETVKQWEPMRQKKNRLAFLGKFIDNNPLAWYWLENSDSFGHFLTAGGYKGTIGSTSVRVWCGVRPVFQLKNC